MSTTRRIMTPDEMQAVERMHGVIYPVGSWDKRFMRSLTSVETISEKEAAQLWRLFVRYRRQMSFTGQSDMLRKDEGLAAPDLRKMSAARRAKERIDAMKAEYTKQMAVNTTKSGMI